MAIQTISMSFTGRNSAWATPGSTASARGVGAVTLHAVLRGCAETASCQEFIQRGEHWYAVVTNEDIRQWCADHGIGSFPGKADCKVAFVRSGDNRLQWYGQRDARPYDAIVEAFRGF